MKLYEEQLKAFLPRSELIKIYPQAELKSFGYGLVLKVIVDYLLEFSVGKADNPHLKEVCSKLGLGRRSLTSNGRKVLYYGIKARLDERSV